MVFITQPYRMPPHPFVYRRLLPWQRPIYLSLSHTPLRFCSTVSISFEFTNLSLYKLSRFPFLNHFAQRLQPGHTSHCQLPNSESKNCFKNHQTLQARSHHQQHKMNFHFTVSYLIHFSVL